MSKAFTTDRSLNQRFSTVPFQATSGALFNREGFDRNQTVAPKKKNVWKLSGPNLHKYGVIPT
jgi:hypothetical protein